jgi:hypothetical protein
MKRPGLALALLAAGLAAFPSQGSVRGSAARPLVAAKEPGPLVGAIQTGELQRLARIDTATLRALAGRRPALGVSMGAWAFSPDRTQLVIGSERADKTAVLRFVDLRTMQKRADLRMPPGAYIDTIAWVVPDRIVALRGTSAGFAVVVVDPTRLRRLSERYLNGSLTSIQRWPEGLVVLLGPEQGIGPSRLVVADRDGGLRSTELTDIWSGWEVEDEENHVGRTRMPALTVDPYGRSAYVVDPDGRIAVIDLVSLSVVYHTPKEPRTTIARLLGWLQPAAEAKAFEGPVRYARWVSESVLAVYGANHYARDEAGNVVHHGTRGAGLKLVDTRSWTVRTIDNSTSYARVHQGLVLATSGSCEETSCVGDGLTVYDLDGSKLFHVLEGKSVWVRAAYEGRAYVAVNDERTRVVDLRTGSVVERTTRLPDLFLGASGPDWR